jgi:hypothetical protein
MSIYNDQFDPINPVSFYLRTDTVVVSTIHTPSIQTMDNDKIKYFHDYFRAQS